METLLSRRGVCRDFAHLAIALLRSRTSRPPRSRICTGPGVNGFPCRGRKLPWKGPGTSSTPRGLARGRSMLRIPPGRDSSDTAFLSTVGGSLTLNQLRVTAVVDSSFRGGPRAAGGAGLALPGRGTQRVPQLSVSLTSSFCSAGVSAGVTRAEMSLTCSRPISFRLPAFPPSVQQYAAAVLRCGMRAHESALFQPLHQPAQAGLAQQGRCR